jgi:hypothetical protein
MENMLITAPGLATAKTDIAEFLQREFDIEIYDELTEDEAYIGLFDPLEFFNFLYDNFNFFEINVKNYLTIKKHFAIPLRDASKREYYFFWALNELIQGTFETDNEDVIYKSCKFIEDTFDKISNKLYPKHSNGAQWLKGIEAVKAHLKYYPDVKSKIVFLIEEKTEYLQYKSDFALELGTPFDVQCDLEISKLEEILKLETIAAKTPQNTMAAAKPASKYRLAKPLSKIDYIRIINALYELRCFQDEEDRYPTKQEIMTAFGNLVNIDLSDYSNSLNKAFNTNVGIEQNVDIFEKMKVKTTELYTNRQQNIKK